jgi:hypothetical protein
MAATLQSIIPFVSTMNNALKQICEDTKDTELRLKEYNRVQLAIMENHMDKNVYVRWGNSNDESFGSSDFITVPPKTAIGRRFHVQNSNISSHRPVVRISKERNDHGLNVVSLLWQLGELHHTTVFIITETEVTLQHDPAVRNWIIGELPMYQDEN